MEMLIAFATGFFAGWFTHRIKANRSKGGGLDSRFPPDARD